MTQTQNLRDCITCEQKKIKAYCALRKVLSATCYRCDSPNWDGEAEMGGQEVCETSKTSRDGRARCPGSWGPASWWTAGLWPSFPPLSAVRASPASNSSVLCGVWNKLGGTGLLEIHRLKHVNAGENHFNSNLKLSLVPEKTYLRMDMKMTNLKCWKK